MGEKRSRNFRTCKTACTSLSMIIVRPLTVKDEAGDEVGDTGGSRLGGIVLHVCVLRPHVPVQVPVAQDPSGIVNGAYGMADSMKGERVA